MSQDRETNLALFIDFDNVALGARDARQRFDIKPLLNRLLEKGKIIVKKAYADWHYYKEHMSPLHEAAIELIEIPMPRISGKNSADIRLVVDAMDLCYSKDHIDTFVIVSGDSDFSPLVSKLRENNKRVIGIGVKNSSSKLLIGNCDEFIFYDDIYRQTQRRLGGTAANVPVDKRDLFDFLVKTVQNLLQENRGVLYSSLIKDTMTRKQPDFTERAHGFSTFGDLLDEARKLGLLVVERDADAGGTWVVQGLGTGVVADSNGDKPSERPSGGGSRSSRRRRRSGRGGGGQDRTNAEAKTAADTAAGKGGKSGSGQTEKAEPTSGNVAPVGEARQGRRRVNKPEPKTETMGRPTGKSAKKVTRKTSTKKAVAEKAPGSKPTTKKVTAKKAPTKKVTKKATKKAAPKKVAKKTAAKKTPTKKRPTKKTPVKKALTKKTTAKKAVAKKAAKKVTKKVKKKTLGRKR